MKPPLTLLYHAVVSVPVEADAVERSLFISPDRFADQMEDLHRRGFRTMTLREFSEALVGDRSPEKRMLLTFDDAYAHVDGTVTPILTRLGYTAVMFAPWQHLDGLRWEADRRNLARLQLASRQQLKRMASTAWEIGSHGFRHVDLTKLDDGQLRTELVESRDKLGWLVDHPVTALAYPFGRANERVQRAAAVAGYETGFLADGSTNRDRFAIGRQLIRGDDGMLIFRLKTSALGDSAFRIRRITPTWIKGAARATLMRAH